MRRDKVDRTDQTPRLQLPLGKGRNATGNLILAKLRSSCLKQEREISESKKWEIQRVEALAKKTITFV